MTNKQLKKEEQNVATQVQKFVADSIMFYQKCKKPDYTEYMKILQACIMGFFIMGAIGYFIKLVFIPINNIILSWMKAIFCAKVKKCLQLSQTILFLQSNIFHINSKPSRSSII